LLEHDLFRKPVPTFRDHALSFDPSKPAKYPDGRLFTDDVIDYRIVFLTKNQCPPTGLKPYMCNRCFRSAISFSKSVLRVRLASCGNHDASMPLRLIVQASSTFHRALLNNLI
jgi:hypothetical protein